MKFFILPMLFLGCMTAMVAQNTMLNPIDAELKRAIAPDGPGAAVVVWERGEVLFQKGYGLSNLTTRTPVSETTVFRMASVSKQFTAAAILLLEKEGQLDISDPVKEYFPELPSGLTAGMTIAHLLTHTSGIPDYESQLDQNRKEQVTDRDIPDLLKSFQAPLFLPGSQFSYSNTAFCLLTLIVEKITGDPYREWMKRNLFDRLEMKSTFLYNPAHPDPSRAMGYSTTSAGVIVNSDQSTTSATLGDGCVYTSLTDYLKWFQALRSGSLVNPFGRLAEVAKLIPGARGYSYGLGWFGYQAHEGAPLELTHTGSTCGFSNVVIAVPEKDLLIACFSNRAGNHAAFENFVSSLQKQLAYPFKIDWKAMHLLTN